MAFEYLAFFGWVTGDRLAAVPGNSRGKNFIDEGIRTAFPYGYHHGKRSTDCRANARLYE